MNKTWLIFRHEFLNTIRRAWFIIMTLAIPVLAILAIGIFQLVSPGAEPKPVETTIIGYVDESGGFNQAEPQGNIEFARYGTQDEATAALIGGDVNEYIVIPPDYRDTRVVNRYTLNKEVETPPATAAAIKRFLIANLLAGEVPPETVNLVDAPVRLVVTRCCHGSLALSQRPIS